MSSVRRDPVSWPRPSGARTFWVGRLRTGGYASLHHRLILDCPPGNVRFAGRAPGRPQTGSGSASRVRRSGRTRRRHVSVSAFQCFSRSSALRASSISLMRNESSLAPGRHFTGTLWSRPAPGPPGTFGVAPDPSKRRACATQLSPASTPRI